MQLAPAGSMLDKVAEDAQCHVEA